ncbi:MAG: SIS domain-containing protein, partial [Firmicutes bacterium]|nr:SIS domain-containing protein [Bacillota bacterium]
EILRQGEKIFVCGTGPISGNIAEMTAFKLQEVGLTALPWSDNRPPETVTSICTPKDVILGLSHSGESIELGKILELVRTESVKSIVLTNYMASTAATYADVVLATAVREIGVYQTDLVPRFGLLFIIEVFLEALSSQKSRSLLGRSFFQEKDSARG